MTESAPSRAASAAPAELIVLATSPLWAAALRPLTATDHRLREVRTVAEADGLLAKAPQSIVVAELTRANVARLLERLLAWRRDFPRAAFAVVATRELAAYGPICLEAGAVQFAASPRALAPLADIARRHLARVPAERLGLAEAVWQSLPWADVAEKRGEQ